LDIFVTSFTARILKQSGNRTVLTGPDVRKGKRIPCGTDHISHFGVYLGSILIIRRIQLP